VLQSSLPVAASRADGAPRLDDAYSVLPTTVGGACVGPLAAKPGLMFVVQTRTSLATFDGLIWVSVEWRLFEAFPPTVLHSAPGNAVRPDAAVGLPAFGPALVLFAPTAAVARTAATARTHPTTNLRI
jgi:hypothetical protein